MTPLPVRGRCLNSWQWCGSRGGFVGAGTERLDSHSEQSGRRPVALQAKGGHFMDYRPAMTLSSPPGWAANPCFDVGSGAATAPEVT